jgi:hypothetical protein
MQYKQVVCLNGHQLTDRASMSEQITGFCTKCGAKLIDCCPSCQHAIYGYEEMDGVFDWTLAPTPIPKYCEKCGKPFPWTQASIEAIQELIDYSSIQQKDKNELAESVDDLIKETPKSQVSVVKWKTIGKSLLKDAHAILINVCSEALLKALYGN